jgi:hypothetical protein
VRIRLLQSLEWVLARIAEGAEDARQWVAVCHDCGRNRYTGKACKEVSA